MKKVLYSAYYAGAFPFGDLAEFEVKVNSPDEMTETNSLLVLWGGADINPNFYGHPKSRTTSCFSGRDFVEWGCLKRAVALGIPIIGVCRGAQMLCAAAGGFLLQDVHNHAGSNHTITTKYGDVLRVNSIHHQMMAGLENVEHDLLAWSTENRSGIYTWKDDQDYVPPSGFKEPEMVYFPKIKGYAVQWHPEAMHEESPATQFILGEYHERESILTT